MGTLQPTEASVPVEDATMQHPLTSKRSPSPAFAVSLNGTIAIILGLFGVACFLFTLHHHAEQHQQTLISSELTYHLESTKSE
ncbi:MAG: hypothetical protein HC865_08380 [Cyanobacteria bacterium RU_5_0]|nr:hypothetical protein [Cyanobacteria bacterium RU_5_0]